MIIAIMCLTAFCFVAYWVLAFTYIFFDQTLGLGNFFVGHFFCTFTLKSFKTSGFTDSNGKQIDANLWICSDGNDYFAVVTTRFIKDGGNQIARLVTAYKVAKDVFPTIEDFITYIATKWNAYEISYVIKAGEQIFLSAR